MISASLRYVFPIRVIARTEAVATFASYRYILYHNLCYSHSRVSQGEDLRAKKNVYSNNISSAGMGSNPFIPQQKCFSCSSVAVRGAETSNLLVVGPPCSFLLPFVTFYLLYCYSCPPHPLPRPPTHPATQPNLILYIPLPYILRECGRRPDEELGSCDLSSAAPSVKTFIRGRTHHLHSDYNDPRGHAGRGVCV